MGLYVDRRTYVGVCVTGYQDNETGTCVGKCDMAYQHDDTGKHVVSVSMAISMMTQERVLVSIHDMGYQHDDTGTFVCKCLCHGLSA